MCGFFIISYFHFLPALTLLEGLLSEIQMMS